MKLPSVILCFLFIISGCAPERNLSEKQYCVVVTRVIDGDTVDIRFENGIEDRVRLAGIDTPERGEDGFQEATDRLRFLVDGRKVWLALPNKRQRGYYRRLIGRLYMDDGRCANDILKKEGLAKRKK